MNELPCIMVVEDDPILKNLLGHTLAGLYETVYAANGDEAISLFERYHPALILLDLTLPGSKDGFAVLQELRARPDEGKTVPVIVVSNLGEQTAKDRVMTLGANAYLVKAEVDVDEIVSTVKKYLPA
ncbi:MAG: OmpR family two-component response regulator [Parcubacteria group bacterium]|nr:OmpR family two-component response regulator [Parcubacteria group bacterium]